MNTFPTCKIYFSLCFILIFIAFLFASCTGNGEKKQADSKDTALSDSAIIAEYEKKNGKISDVFIGSDSIPVIQPKPGPVRINLGGDSGFITEKKGLPFLVSQLLTDSTDYLWRMLYDTDTIGKYYKLPSGNYLLCLVNTDHGSHAYHYLFEIASEGKTKKIVSKQKYRSGNYDCCWKNDYEGFRKMKGFFYLKTCTTGSGYCGRTFYLFKALHPQDSINRIYETYYSGNAVQFQSLASDIRLEGNSLRINYTLRDGKIVFNSDSKEKNTDRSRKFTVNYSYKNDNWFTSDSTNLRDLLF